MRAFSLNPNSMSLTARMKAASAAAHQQAEQHTFLRELISGQLPPSAYLAYLGQLRNIYFALEEGISHSPRLKEIADEFDLWRSQAIDRDRAYFVSNYDLETSEPAPTNAYATHLRSVSKDWPQGLIAHFYTRYLGDLSGGQMLKKFVQKAYHLSDSQGTSFYNFDSVESPRTCVVQIKEKLESITLSEATVEQLEQECLRAFQLSHSVFDTAMLKV